MKRLKVRRYDPEKGHKRESDDFVTMYRCACGGVLWKIRKGDIECFKCGSSVIMGNHMDPNDFNDLIKEIAEEGCHT